MDSNQDFGSILNNHLSLGRADRPQREPAGPAPSVDEFVKSVMPAAQKAAQKLNVPVEAVIGQWGLETGWGKSVIPGTNNLGNIKGRGVAATDNMTGSRDEYRQYGSVDEFADDFTNLVGNGRYKAVPGSRDAQGYFQNLKAAGYAEDPDYVAKGGKAAAMAAEALKRSGVEAPAKVAQQGPDLSKAPKWADVEANPQFTKLPPEKQAEAKAAYFDYWIAPRAGDQGDALRQQFLKPAPKPNADANLGTDVGNLLGTGVNSMAQNVRELVGRIPGVGQPIVESLDAVDKWATGKSSDELLKGNVKAAQERLTPEMQAAGNKKWWDSDKGTFGDAWSDPRSYVSGIVQSLPEQALTMIPAMRLAKGIYASKVAAGVAPEVASAAAARAAALAGGASEGALAGAASSREVRDKIMAMKSEQMQGSEAMQTLIGQGMTFEQARDAIANDAATQAFITSGVATGMFGGFGDRMLAKAMTEGIGKNFAARVAKGVVGEGVLEEFPQEALGAVAENAALRRADPSIALTDDALNRGLGGLATGGIQGGAMAGAFGRNQQPTQANVTPDGRIDPDSQDFSQQQDAELDAAMQQAQAPAMPAQPAPTVPTGTPESQSADDLVRQMAEQAGIPTETVLPTPKTAPTDEAQAAQQWMESSEVDATAQPVGTTGEGAGYAQPTQEQPTLPQPPTGPRTEKEARALRAQQQENPANGTEANQTIEATPQREEAPAAPTGIATNPIPASVEADKKPKTEKEAAARRMEAVKQSLTPEAPVLQNRDRSNPASIAQMQSIASNPDYGRLGFSRDFANGAPVVAGAEQNIPEQQRGKQDTAVAVDGTRIPVQYAVVEAGDVLTSNNVDGTSNPAYGDASTPAVRAIAGNGRVAGLTAAYRQGTAAQYKQELLADTALHGVPAEAIEAMQNPVLVRVMPNEAVTANIGDLSNTQGNLSLTAVEQAKNDAARVELAALEFDESGGITAQAVRQFVQAMPKAEQGGLIDTNGQPSKQAVDRLQAAVFAKAYGNDQLVRLFAQAQDPEARLILSALSQLAPKMARLEGAGALDIRPIITQAAEIAVNARREGKAIGIAAKQLDMAADSAVGVVLDLFASSPRSNKPIVEAIANAVDFAYAEATKPDMDMFGEVEKATREDVINKLKSQNERTSQQNLEQPAGRVAAENNADGQQADDGATANAGATETGRATQGAGQVTEAGAEYSVRQQFSLFGSTQSDQLQLFLDSGPVPSQTGPGSVAAQREAVGAIADLQSTASILAAALTRDYAARQKVSLVGQTVKSPEDLATLAQVYRDPRFETFRVVFVDSSFKVVSQLGLTSRLPASAVAIMGDDTQAYLNDLMATARKAGAVGYYLLHNHPSGRANPSGADVNLTRTFAMGTPGMQMMSHVVIDTNEYSVIDGAGNAELKKKDFGQPAPLGSGNVTFNNPDDVVAYAKQVQADTGAVTLIATDTQYKVKGVTTLPAAALNGDKGLVRLRVARALMKMNASNVFAVGREMGALAKLGGIVVDAIHIEPSGKASSLAGRGMLNPVNQGAFPKDRRTRVTADSSPEFAYLRFNPSELKSAGQRVAEGDLFSPSANAWQQDLFGSPAAAPEQPKPKTEKEARAQRAEKPAQPVEQVSTASTDVEEISDFGAQNAGFESAEIAQIFSAQKQAITKRIGGLVATNAEKRKAAMRSGRKHNTNAAKMIEDVAGAFGIPPTNRVLDKAVGMAVLGDDAMAAMAIIEFAVEKAKAETARLNELAAKKATPPDVVSTAKPKTEKEAKAQRETPQPDKPATVENFGEKLPPARRAMAAELNEDLTDDKIASMPLSQIWPATENDAIEDTFAAAVAHVMREAIPAKPRSPYKVKAWVGKVRLLRGFAADMMGGKYTKEKFITETAKVYALKDMLSKIKLLEQIDRADWARIGDVTEAPNAVRYEDNKQIPTPSVSVTVDGRNHWLRGSGDVAYHLDGIKAMLSTAAPENKMQFEIRQESGGARKVFINKKGDKEYRRLMEFDTVAEARAAVQNQYTELVAAWEGVKARDNITERDVRSDVNRDRTGKDHRQGKDISADDFESKFGFRGGEFGKWVKQGDGAKERQFLLNNAYDALMDLSDLLGTPPKAISLEGTLGIAFGSRGSGGAAAHFEPSNLVINLTKTRGAGSLAHEWFHALDNYFARKRGGEVPMDAGGQTGYRNNNYITHKTTPLMVRKDGRGSPLTKERLEQWRKQSPNSGYLAEDQWHEDPKHKAGVRVEVERAFGDLVAALNASPMLKRARVLDGVKDSGDGYWSRTLEMAARSFENFVQVRMMEQGYHNDFLANVKSAPEVGKNVGRYPYLMPEEVAPIATAFDNLFATIQTKETADGNVAMFNRGQSAPATIAEVQSIAQSLLNGNAKTPNLVVVQKAADLPFDAPDDAKGVYLSGSLYLVADNLGPVVNGGDAVVGTGVVVAETVAHELIGHFGLRGFFGKELDQTLNQIHESNPKVQKLAYKWRQENTDLIAKWKAKFNKSDSWVKARSIEEALASMAEKGETLSGWRRLAAVVQGFLRKAGLARLANMLEAKTDAEALLALKKAEMFVKKGLSVSDDVSDLEYPMFARDSANTLGLEGGANTPLWDVPPPSQMDDFIYNIQDRQINLKRVQQAISEVTAIPEHFDAYQKEELYHGRVAARTHKFLDREVKPLLMDMKLKGIDMDALEAYLWARHAKERNAQIAKVNPDMPDGGSGLADAQADQYMAGEDVVGKDGEVIIKGMKQANRNRLEALAARVDAINKGTKQVLLQYGLESPDTVAAWESTYKNYVPLHREDMEGVTPIGSGFSVKGDASKRALGSQRRVVDVLAHLALQREAAITRGEKNRVGLALYGLALQNKNADFWEADKVPMKRDIDKETGLVVEYPDPTYKSRANVLVLRVGGQDRAIVFNERNERAVRAAEVLKNLDVQSFGQIMGTLATATRFLAAINTQYNPVFGLVNGLRDVQAAALNLTSTPLANHKWEVTKAVFGALRAIWKIERSGKAGNEYDALYENLKLDGGTTGYREIFRMGADRAKALQKEFDSFDANMGRKALDALLNWLDHFNTAIENATRLAAYKVGTEQVGLSRNAAASVAKNVTVNFNRKGKIGREAGVFYAFFNAAVQGTTRTLDTLKGPAGKKIMAGGVALGVIQALVAAVGFDDDEWEDIPEFLKQRNFIIPTGNNTYVMFPMPLGFNVLPNLGRIPTEMALNGGRDMGKRVGDLLSVLLDSTNPLGSATLAQMIAPTVVDPLVALSENKNFAGSPIYKEDRNPLQPTPGFTRAKDASSEVSRAIAKGVNYVTGGTRYTPGWASPTPDQIDYIFGTLTGGAGRELNKLYQSVELQATGQDVPESKKPVIGRFFGTTDDAFAVSARYWTNVKELNTIESEIKGRRKDRVDATEYKQQHPEHRLIGMANEYEREVTKLRSTRHKTEFDEKLTETERTEKLKELDARIQAKMTRFNSKVAEAKKKREAVTAE